MTAGPRGFHILFPPGWNRYRIDEEGKREFITRASQRMKALGRPDLDAQLRLLIGEQWRALEQTRAFAVYLPDQDTGATPVPLTVAVRKFASSEGSDFARGVRERFSVTAETIDTPLGPVLRWRTSSTGRDELADVRMIQLGYGFPAPVEDARIGLLFIASIPVVSDADPAIVEGIVELSDTIMETFRWR